MTINRQAAMFAGVLALVPAACGGDGAPQQPSPSVANTRPASTAELTVLEPTFDEVVAGPSVLVKVKVEGAKVLVPGEATLKVRPDTGHVHIELDGETITLTAGLSYEIPEVEPGEHLLRVEFSASDHGSFNPPVLADVRFTVE